MEAAFSTEKQDQKLNVPPQLRALGVFNRCSFWLQVVVEPPAKKATP
jgi:hypothetical protein